MDDSLISISCPHLVLKFQMCLEHSQMAVILLHQFITPEKRPAILALHL